MAADATPSDTGVVRVAGVAQARRRSARRRRGFAAALSVVGGHALILFAFISGHVDPPLTLAPETIPVEMVGAPPAPDVAAPPTPAPPSPVQPPPPKALARRTPTRPDVKPLPAGEGKAADEGVQLSDAQVASAATAGAGGAGGACDMARRLQTALRKDPMIQAAVADAHRAQAGKALFVWNGDWIRSRGQDGNGLAAVREAIMWEVAFAPQACRAEPVHGLILVSLNDAPGAARLVLGSDEWRWSDLLHPRPGG